MPTITPRTGRPVSPETAPKLDALHAFIVSRFVPPFYEPPTVRECAAAIDRSAPEALRLIGVLVKQGRLLKSPSGKVVPKKYIHLTEEQSAAPREWHELPVPEKMTDPEWADYFTGEINTICVNSEIVARSILQAAPTPEQTFSGREWIDRRE